MQGFGEIESLQIEGCPYAVFGVPYGLRKYSAETLVSTEAMEFEVYKTITDTPFDYYICYNEKVINFLDKNDSKLFIVGILRASALFDINILPETYNPITANCFYCMQAGDKIQLEIAENSASDFYSYLLYYSSNGTDYSLLSELIGKNNRFYTTNSLGAGLHYFKTKTKDIIGNISDYSNVKVINISGGLIPSAFTSISWSFSSTTGKMTIRGNVKSGEEDIAVAMAVYCNWLPCMTETLNHNFNQKNLRHTVINNTQGEYIEFESQRLSVGVWGFGVAPINKYDIENLITEKYYYIHYVDEVLTATQITYPIKPYEITATALSGGNIQIDILYIYQENIQIKLYENDILIETFNKNISGSSSFIYTRADGTEYSYYAVATNNFQDSMPTNIVTATADSSAPEISNIILAKVVV